MTRSLEEPCPPVPCSFEVESPRSKEFKQKTSLSIHCRRGHPGQTGAMAAVPSCPLLLPAPEGQFGSLGEGGVLEKGVCCGWGAAAAAAGSACSGIEFQHFSDENKSASLLLCLALWDHYRLGHIYRLPVSHRLYPSPRAENSLR